MRNHLLTLCLTALATAVFADGPMTAEEFDAYTRDKTFYYGSDGIPYGAEEHLSGRRVIWTFLDGKCQDGIWYPDGDQICFVYENTPDPQCWRFERSGGGLVAQYVNDPSQSELYEVKKSHEPLLCLGPEVGVKYQIDDIKR